jgi:hypothetical protein
MWQIALCFVLILALVDFDPPDDELPPSGGEAYA